MEMLHKQEFLNLKVIRHLNTDEVFDHIDRGQIHQALKQGLEVAYRLFP